MLEQESSISNCKLSNINSSIMYKLPVLPKSHCGTTPRKVCLKLKALQPIQSRAYTDGYHNLLAEVMELGCKTQAEGGSCLGKQPGIVHG